RVLATSRHSARHDCRSGSGSLASASSPRTVAKSGSSSHCRSTSLIGKGASSCPFSKRRFHSARSSRSQSSARRRRPGRLARTESGRVLALAGGGQHGGAGGVAAVRSLCDVGQRAIGGEGFGEEARGGGVMLAVWRPAEQRKCEGLGGIFRLVFAVQDGRQAL